MRRGFWGVAFAFGATMLGTTLPTPLYPLLQHEYGFGELVSTVLYAVYALGVIAALLLFGHASDVIGRRRVLLAALACAALSAVAFLSGAGLAALLIGRVLSGLSAGLVTGTATAALGDLGRDRHHAGLVATVANMFGLGCGPLLSGVLATTAPDPLHLPFLAHLALLVPAAVAVWRAPEPVPARPGARLRIDRPTVPAEVRPVFLPAATAMFAIFAVFGLAAAVEPSLLVRLLDVRSPVVPGAVVFAMFAASAAGQVASRRLRTSRALSLGCAIVLVGIIGFATALATESAAVLAAATVVIGAGQGVAFRAAIAAIGDRAPADRRAGTMSGFFVVVYAGISLPVVLAGAASVHWGLRASGLGFAAAVAVLIVVALTANSPQRTTR
ncbi:MFS transporter [Labedaea rhizosphaerae]|uniref:Putative MFS family arabinose efflux permease n=1 Tax=Labedaea rhizosphaerae TaxID=598644 RepID=A0A4R6S4X6_LABRH|nr:MFS transporter [Labedaea rhizosphaerae]TDP94782.1 putative MFS family arabinose efflux permease [Labedaea rhizosphaerae]